jgi:hypothetical protein
MGDWPRLTAMAMFAAVAPSAALAAPPAKACDLIGQAQMTSIFGAPFGAGVESDISAGSVCGFTNNGETINVGVMVPADLNMTPEAAFASSAISNTSATNTPVPILGDKGSYYQAYVGSSVANYGIWVLVGDRLLNIDVTGANPPNIKAAIITAATQNVPKL